MYSSAPMPDLASRARTVVPIICAGLALMMPIQAPAHGTEREEARMAECIARLRTVGPSLKNGALGSAIDGG